MQILKDLYLVGGRHFFNTDVKVADCNTYAVNTDDGIVLIDCGYDAGSLAMIDRNLRYWGLDPADIRYVLLTHSHLDHTGNVKILQERGASIIAHHTVGDALTSGDERTIHYAFDRADYPVCQIDRRLGEREVVEIGSWRFEAINAPGHSDGTMVYVTECDGKKVMFIGDFVFHERALNTDETIAWNGGTEFDTDKFLDSLVCIQRIRADVVLPGHYGFLVQNGSTMIDKALVVALRAWGNQYAKRRRV